MFFPHQPESSLRRSRYPKCCRSAKRYWPDTRCRTAAPGTSAAAVWRSWTGHCPWPRFRPAQTGTVRATWRNSKTTWWTSWFTQALEAGSFFTPSTSGLPSGLHYGNWKVGNFRHQTCQTGRRRELWGDVCRDNRVQTAKLYAGHTVRQLQRNWLALMEGTFDGQRSARGVTSPPWGGPSVA